MSCIFGQLLPEKYIKVLAMESRILRKNSVVVLFTREAIEKLAQFHNTTGNEKNGYEILERMHPGTSSGKTKTGNN